MNPAQLASSFTNTVANFAFQAALTFGAEPNTAQTSGTQVEIVLPYRHSIYSLPMFHFTEVTPCSR